MRTITLIVYLFLELSDEVKQKVIKRYQEELYEGEHGAPYFASWAIDDCSLLEPPHEEMVAALGEDYYIRNGEQFVFKNNRKGITFDERDLDFSEALEITNREMFLTYLGIEKRFHHSIDIEISTSNGDSILELPYDEDQAEAEIDPTEKITDILDPQIRAACNKFEDHRYNILKRIHKDIDYRYSEESITEELSNSTFEYLEDGERINIGNQYSFRINIA
jgi:hypothetical protein